MMTTDYELLTNTDDEQDTAPPPEKPEPPETHHLKMARRCMAEYEQRINDDRVRFSDIVDRQVYEDRAYKQAIMHAAIAQAEVAESMLEFVAELIDKTDLVNSLLQWGYKQERIG